MKRHISARAIAKDTLERYSGSPIGKFCSKLIITNFPAYVQYFARSRKVKIYEGATFLVAHCKKEDISILDFKIGSPAAALVIDLCSFLPIRSAIFLGMCGGLRQHYKIGEYLVPVASVRGEGISEHYFPSEIPALANFLMQRAVTELLDIEKIPYHVGATYTTDMRFWEFNKDFVERIKQSRAQGIEMECAALFIASYKRRFNLGALLLISDKPLQREGIKTKSSSEYIFNTFMAQHVELGIRILKIATEMQDKAVKGSYNSRGEYK